MAIVISGVNNNDKITATDGTIDLLSGVNYDSSITAPDLTASNRISGNFIDVNTTIQLGVSGIVTATTFLGNLTGNVNATSNLLLQIGGSEKFRVGSSGQLGIAGANYGTSGQVLTSGGSSSAATWSTVTGTTINNNAANRVITGEGGTTLNGEANLIFTGTRLGLNNTSPTPLNGDGTGMISVAGGNPEVVLVRTTSGTEAKASIRVTDGEDFKIAVKDGSGSTIDALAIDTGTGDMQTRDIYPESNNSYSLGTNAIRWANIYTNDLNLSNEGSANDVDGTWGDWTLQEGENKIFMINNRTGKKYSLKMEEE